MLRTWIATVAITAIVPMIAFSDTIGPWELSPPDSAQVIVGTNGGWLNIDNSVIDVNEAFTGEPIAADGWANLAPGEIFEVTFSSGVVNRLGSDLVMLDARYDNGSYRITTDFDGFSASVDLLAGDFINTDTRAEYYFLTVNNGPYPCNIWGQEIDLSDLGVPANASVFSVRFEALNSGCDPIGLGALSSSGIQMSLTGTCPGDAEFNIFNATPNGQIALLFSTGPGDFVIPGGLQCAGTQLGLSNIGIRLVADATADANGEAVINGFLPAAACGGAIQAIDLTTCITSNVIQIN